MLVTATRIYARSLPRRDSKGPQPFMLTVTGSTLWHPLSALPGGSGSRLARMFLTAKDFRVSSTALQPRG